MFIIESVTKNGITMRQTVRGARTMLPIMKSRTSLEGRLHKHIRVMTEHGQTLFDIGHHLEADSFEEFRVEEPKKAKLKAVA